MVFRDRVEAGRQLGEHLRKSLGSRRCRVFGLARGGVVVAREVADALGAPLDVMAVAKVGAPLQPELAVGALAEGGGAHWEWDTLDDLGLDRKWCEQAAERARQELERRQLAYRGGLLGAVSAEETAVVVDDGLATGSTMVAAVDGLRRLGAKRVVVAAPVASREGMRACERRADQVVALLTPLSFGAVGAFYEDFRPVSDDVVKRCLRVEGVAG